MAEAAAFIRTWSVGKYRCTLTVPKVEPDSRACACVEWAPVLPERLTRGEIRQYRAGRDVALAECARALGIQIAVMDL